MIDEIKRRFRYLFEKNINKKKDLILFQNYDYDFNFYGDNCWVCDKKERKWNIEGKTVCNNCKEILKGENLSNFEDDYICQLLLKERAILEKEKLEEQQFRESQIKKGLIEHGDKWYTKKEYNNFLINKFKENMHQNQKTIIELENEIFLQGEEMCCIDCNYFWNIKKPKGKPAKCPCCNSKNIKLMKIIINEKEIEYFKERIKEFESEIIKK